MRKRSVSAKSKGKERGKGAAPVRRVHREKAGESEERFRTIFEESGDGLLIADIETKRFLDANRKMCEMLGYGRDELLTLGVRDIHSDEALPDVLDHFEKQLKGDIDVARELPVKRKDGSILYADISARPIALESGRCMLGAFRDVTKRRRAEKRIAQLAKFPGENPNPVLRVSTDGNIMYANKTASLLLAAWGCHISGPLPDDLQSVVAKALTSGRTENQEAQCAECVFAVTFAPVVAAGYVNVYGLDITARKEAEEELRRYESMVSSSMDMMALLNAEYVYLSVNDAYLRAFGKSRDEVLGRTPADFVGEEFFQRVIKPHAERCLGGEEVRYQDWFEFPVSGRQYMDIAYSPYIGENKEVRGFVVTARDITELRMAEEERHRSEARLRALFENMSSGVAVYEAEGDGRSFIIKDLNPAGERISRVRKADIIGRRVMDVFPGIDKLGLIGVFRKVWKTGATMHHPASLYKDGRLTAWYDNYVYKLPGGEIVAVYTDVTEQKHAEEVIRESEERLELALAGGGLGTWDWNVRTGEVIFNERWAGMLGYALDEVEPHVRSWEKLVHPEDMPRVREILNKHLEGRTPFFETELRLLMKSGEWKWILDRGRVVARGADGTPLRAAGTHLDLSERKRLEEQLRHVQKMEAVGTLAGGLAHDFNNILAGIIGYASLIKKELQESPLAPDIEAIEKLAWRGADITKGLLAFSRKGESRPALLSINEVIDEVLEVVGRTAGSHITIRAELSPDTRNISEDRGQLHQAVMNLCINACESMPDKGVLTVTTGNAEPGEEFFSLHPSLKEGRYIFIAVSDTGKGMDEATQERIFEPFFTTKAEKSGTGLGLAMVIGIIEGHDGCIEVESEAGRGSTFTVYLPASEGKAKTDESEPLGTLRGDETILLVDDEDDFRRSVGRWLKDMGYTVIQAADGEEAVKALGDKKGEIDIVLLDMMMRGMSGSETVSRMREIAPDLPIVMCTGYAVQAATRKLLEKEVRGFLQKPFDIEDVSLKVRKVLDGG